MPRDHKIPLIQRIAQQARLTFRAPQDPSGGDQVLQDRLAQLVALVTALRAADLKVAPPKDKAGSAAAAGAEPGAGAGPQGPPVTYMHICETEEFSMGVFLLRGGASIPLHDHPGMNGMLKVLYGKVTVRCFDKLEHALTSAPPSFAPPLAVPEAASVWRATLRSASDFSESSGPCLLAPLRDNLHQIHAVGGPAAFLDILAPPYDPEAGRDCHYYRVLQAAAEGSNGEREERQDGEQEEAWLLEVPQPEDFWCGGEPYPGPSVSV